MTAVLPEIGEVSDAVRGDRHARSAGRHRAPEDATTGSMGVVPADRRSRSAHGRYGRPVGSPPQGTAHGAPSHSLSRAARTAGLSLAALGAVATAGGVATHGLLGGDERPATGETAISPELASANLALAPSAPTDAATSAVLPVVSQASSGTSSIKHDSPDSRAAATRRAQPPAQHAASDDGEHQASSSAGSSLGARALAIARGKIGVPYVWGATGPNSFDCSGLTQWAFEQVGAELPRTSQAQSQAGQEVSTDNLQAGDLIFFYSPVSHVAIYAGNGQILEAPQSGEDVKLSSLSRRMDDVVGVRRITA